MCVGDLEKEVSSPHVIIPAIQALRSVLNAFSVVNRKNMFVYQERATKAVYYLRYVTPENMGYSLSQGWRGSRHTQTPCLSLLGFWRHLAVTDHGKGTLCPHP